MNTRKRKNKVLHSGHTFSSIDSFPKGVLPTKRDVLQRVLHFPNLRTVKTADAVAGELIELWTWCNVYPLHQYTVSKKIQDAVKKFSIIDRWPKRKRGDTFLEKEASFMSDIDALFDIFCTEQERRRELETEHKLRMTPDDFKFYEDQKNHQKMRCIDDIMSLDTSDVLFIRRSVRATSRDEPSTSGPSALDEPSTSTCSLSEAESISSSASTSNESTVFSTYKPSFTTDQNRRKWSHLARMSDRYELSDRAAAAVANSVLQDIGLITDTDKSYVIDRSKLRREEVQQMEQQNFSIVTGLYIDGRKDATLKLVQKPHGKMTRSIELEEHISVVGEPGEYYLTHLCPGNGKGRTIAQELFQAIQGTALESKLTIVGTDGTASMTGRRNGCIRALEELLDKPLQWAICMLHSNELPLRHVFLNLDGTTRSPDSFSGPIGKQLEGPVSEWPVASFKRISNPSFPELSPDVVENLSTDQYYAYRICMAVMLGEVDENLQFLEIGPIVHSRWLTLASRLLRLYVSVNKPSRNLALLAEFCMKVYFPSWFDIKSNCKITDGSKNFFNLMQRIVKFPNKTIVKTALEVLQRNAFFAHPENVILSMLADEDENVRRLAVNKVHFFRGKLSSFNIENDNFDDGFIVNDSDEDDDSANLTSIRNSAVREFALPSLNTKARAFHKMVNLNVEGLQEPPALRCFTDEEVEGFRIHPLHLDHPCHNQSVERHVKLVTEASSQVVGFERRDGMIRQKIKSRKLMRSFETKKHF